MRSILCPFCFKKFRTGQWQFRCLTDDPALCPNTEDKQLARFRGVARLSINRVFDQQSKLARWLGNRKASCPDCGAESYKILCPECHNTLPNDFGQFSSYTFGLIGPREAGKSQYIGVIIHRLQREIGARLDCALSTWTDDTATRYETDFYNPLFKEKRVVEATQSARMVYAHKTPLLYCLTMNRNGLLRKGQRAASLTFFDTAGEDLLKEDIVDSEVRYLSHSDGLILLVDPLQIDEVRSQIKDKSILPVEQANPYDLVARIDNVIRKHHGLSRGKKKIKIPLAIAFSKIDALGDVIHPGSIVNREADHDGAFDRPDIEQVHAEMEGLLTKWLGAGFDKFLNQNFENYCYLGLSALGSPPTEGGQLSRPVNPHRIEDPLLWLMWRNRLIPARKGAG